VRRRGWILLGTALLGLAAGAAWLLRPPPPEAFPLVELVPADAVLYADFPDYRTLEALPLPDAGGLRRRLDPARPHLAGPAAVYVDDSGGWVFLARLTRASALVAGADVEDGAVVVASSPETLARHRARKARLDGLETFRTLGSRIFLNLDAFRPAARRDFPAAGFELVSLRPLVLRGRALTRGELYRLYVERYLQAPRRPVPEGAVGALLLEPPVRTWDDALLGLGPADRERVDREALSLSRDLLGGRPLRDFLGRLGPGWALRVVPTPHGPPAAVLALDLPDPETRELLPRMLHKVAIDVAQLYRNQGEAPPFELSLRDGVWHVRIARAAELRLGEAFSPAFSIRGDRWILASCAELMDLPSSGEEARQSALRVDLAAGFAMARGLLPLLADGAFRDEAERAGAQLFAKAYGPDTQAALRKQMPDPADLRRFLAAQRSKLVARALEEIAGTPRHAERRRELGAELERWETALAGLGRLELDARFSAGSVELEIRLEEKAAAGR
jgi:hypothetical protein